MVPIYRSIQDIVEAVKESRRVSINVSEVTNTLEKHVGQFRTTDTGIKSIRLIRSDDARTLHYCLLMEPSLNSHDAYSRFEIVIVPSPANHIEGDITLSSQSEAWIQFLEQFGWVRLGMIDISQLGTIKRIYEIGKEFNGFWAITAFS